MEPVRPRGPERTRNDSQRFEEYMIGDPAFACLALSLFVFRRDLTAVHSPIIIRYRDSFHGFRKTSRAEPRSGLLRYPFWGCPFADFLSRKSPAIHNHTDTSIPRTIVLSTLVTLFYFFSIAESFTSSRAFGTHRILRNSIDMMSSPSMNAVCSIPGLRICYINWLTNFLIITDQDPPEEECEEGYSVLLDGLWRFWDW